ncbi:four-carbon acid sugar kinase family protein [Halomonas sp. NO4]|uniref:four-carbon acid sugar kinase family protein n=1 Tax=Halomonas sp. NO4 TaxID=2484813 RepID=UPI0013D01A7A|nr:four-carbon acid sugar kinase family protein [Halomonas sp. NO4]
MSRCRVAIIADDLTGALDAAAPFAARGASTRVVIDLSKLAEALASWEEPPAVVAVNTESRHLPPAAAAERVERAARLLVPLAPTVWFKKVDSTLRGAVVAECLALRRVVERPLLLAPAVPAQGRIVQGAEVWVDGAPLASTAYGQDARSAPPLGPLDRLFGDHGVTLTRHRSGPGQALPAGDCVADAASDTDLAHLYDRVLSGGPARLLAGAAGLATAVAQRHVGRLCGPTRLLEGVTAHLFAVGSRSPRAREQLARLCAEVPAPTTVEALAVSSASGRSSAEVVIPGGDSSAFHDPERVAAAMAERVAVAVTAWPSGVYLLFLTGGDIAMATLRRLGVTSIAVQGEWAPGVAVGWLDGDRRRRVMTKAGGFGDPDLLARLRRRLHGTATPVASTATVR